MKKPINTGKPIEKSLLRLSQNKVYDKNQQVVEIWRDKNLIAVIYPTVSGVKIVSNPLKDQIKIENINFTKGEIKNISVVFINFI